jgi:hypothetical protein
MTLMRWLAVGTSVNSIKDHRSPYKMVQQHLLPKFGPNPLPGPQEAALLSPAEPSRPPGVKKSWFRRWVPLKRKKKMNPATEIKLSAMATSPVSTVAEFYPQGRWTANPFHQKPGPKRAAASVQGELALDMVKVVRNDLNDSDLELIAGRAVGSAPSPIRSQGASEGSGYLWSRLTTRLFGAGET